MSEPINDGGPAFPCPQVFENMPFDDYCQLDGINASALKGVGRNSAKHLHAYLSGKMDRDDSKDMKFGRAAHCMILEPERFDGAFPIAGACSAIKDDGEQCSNSPSLRLKNGEWRCGVHKEVKEIDPNDAKGKKKIVVEVAQPVADFVTPSELSRLCGLRDSVKASNVQDYLRRPGYSEYVIQWEQMGFTLKTRLDRMAVEPHLITQIDLKKCQVGAANYDDCQWACEKYGYHIASWFHYAAARAVYGDSVEIESYVLFVEDNAPYDTHLLRVSNDDIEIAQQSVVTQLSRYKRCLDAGEFEGCQPFINPDKSGLLSARTVKQLRG
jgi:hypothetical protein